MTDLLPKQTRDAWNAGQHDADTGAPFDSTLSQDVAYRLGWLAGGGTLPESWLAKFPPLAADTVTPPEHSSSPFHKVLQVGWNIPGGIAYVQQFGRAWGYLICDDKTRSPLAADWSMSWSVLEAIEALNAVLGTPAA